MKLSIGLSPSISDIVKGRTAGVAASGPNYVVQDTFTDTGRLNAHTPDVDTVGTGWKILKSITGAGDYAAVNGTQALIDSGGADQYSALINSGVSDFTLNIDFTTPDEDLWDFYILFRHGGGSSYLDGFRVRFLDGSGGAALYKNWSSSIASSSPTTWTVARNTNYTCTVVANGTSIEAELFKVGTGSLGTISATDATDQTNTWHGFGQYFESTTSWRGVLVNDFTIE